MIINYAKVVLHVFLTGFLFLVAPVIEPYAQVAPAVRIAQWDYPFGNVSDETIVPADSLTLSHVLSFVARANSSLRAGRKRITAAEGLVAQANVRPNPVLEIEAEEVGGDASGFRESEINITLSQEFELWGKRGARKKLAKSETEIVRVAVRFADYDVYASAVEGFLEVAHAQEQVALSLEASRIARSIAETAKMRVSRGATLRSELLLGELEFERAQLNLAQAKFDLTTAKERLSSLWKEPGSDFTVRPPTTDLETITNIERFRSLVADSRDLIALNIQEQAIKARLNLELSSARPSLTLTGGVKRLAGDNSNSFIIGAGFPLPFFDRNQGSTASLRASIEALKLEREQARTNTETEFESIRRKLKQLVSRHQTLSATILPKSEEVYNSLKSAYDRGRVSYSILLEAQRTLIDLRFELSDIDLTIRQEVVSLERLLGVIIN